MSLEQRLAWRNVWRNRRRTGLCVAATVFAVFLVVLSVAMADGTHEKMIEDGVRIQSGHVTVTGVGYLDDGTMVICEQSSHLVGQEIDVIVTSVLQSSAGRMIFGRQVHHTSDN